MKQENISNLRASVCVATFNGAKYLRAQLQSILENLADNDEIIVLDDGSTDGTLMLLDNYGDSRMKVYKNVKNIGHVGTFARLLSLATREIIIMCDQDDIWTEGRLDYIRSALSKSDAWLVTGEMKTIDSDGQVLNATQVGIRSVDSNQNIANIIRIVLGTSPYYGCLMGMKRDLVNKVLPIPRYVESHDLWIALYANIIRRNSHIEKVLTYRRIHGDNCSLKKRLLIKKVWSRLINLFCCFHIFIRIVVQKMCSQYLLRQTNCNKTAVVRLNKR